MQSADVTMVEQLVYLFRGVVKAIVPLTVGGALLFVFFQFAGDMA